MTDHYKPLIKYFKSNPDAFWKDVILMKNQNSINGKIGFSEKSIENDFKNLSQPSKGKLWYLSEKIPVYLNHLELCGYIEKKEGRDTYSITAKGFSLIEDEGGNITIAKRKRRENRRFDFEYFKLGYDTLISLLALLLSIAALIISLKK